MLCMHNGKLYHFAFLKNENDGNPNIRYLIHKNRVD
jgi:hypothetical protein